jgi:hypothetical protein
MSEPRFVVTSVTGFSGEGGNGARERTVYQVLDAAYCYELVWETYIERVARRGCDVLNSGDLTWPHGHVGTLWCSGGGRTACRCEACRNRRNAYKKSQRAA